MAKKSASGFNMSEAIRNILSANNKLTGAEVKEQLLKDNPGLKINHNSFGVAFYTMRKKLGLKSGRRSKAGRVARAAKASGSGMDFGALKHAAALLRAVGSLEAAIEAVKTVQAVQISDGGAQS